VEKKASQQINTTVELGGIDIDFLDEIVLEDLYVEDQQGDTLFYSSRFRVAFDLWFALKKTVSIRTVEIQSMYANLYQLPGSNALNFEFISEAFASKDTLQTQDTTASAWNIRANELLLSDIRFRYDADSTNMQLSLRKLNLFFDKISLEEKLISADKIDIDGLAFRMQTSATSADSTEQQVSDTTDSNVINPSGYTFEIALLDIANSKLAYLVGQPPQQDTLPRPMDYENLSFIQIQTQIENIFVGAKKISFDLPSMAFTEANSGFRLENFSARATLDMPTVQARVLELRTGYSNLNGSVDYRMLLTDNTAELMNSIYLQSELDETVLGMQDIGYFSDVLEAYPGLKALEARLSWQVNVENGQGTLDTLSLSIPNKANMRAKAAFRELAALDSTTGGSPYFDIKLTELNTNYAFLSSVLDDSTAQYLERFQQKNLFLTAQAQGHLDDLRADLRLQTGIGELEASGRYQEQVNSATISANLGAEKIDMNTIMLALGNSDSVAQEYGPLSMQAEVSAMPIYGQDTTINSLSADLMVENFTYRGYTYENLSLEASQERDSVYAVINYEDSLLNMHAEANALLQEENSRYELAMRLQNADLFRLNLIPDSVIISETNLQAEATGNTISNIVGKLKISNSNFIKGNKQYVMDSLVLSAAKSDSNREFAFRSDYVDISLNGQYELDQLPTALENLQQYYLTAYEAPINQVNTVRTFGTNQELFLDINIQETPHLARVFLPSLEIRQPVSGNAYFNSNRKKLTFRLYAPNVLYEDYSIDSLLITAQTSQQAIRLITKSDLVQIGTFSLPELVLQGDISGAPQDDLSPNKKRLFATAADLNLKIGAENATYRLNLNTVLSSSQDTITIRVDSSELILENKPWRFSQDTRITYADNYLAIDDFYLQQEQQIIRITTDNQQDTTDLRLLIDQLVTGPLLSSLDMENYEADGILNADIRLGDMFNAGNLDASLRIDSLKVQAMPIGALSMQAKGQGLATEQADEPLQLELALDGENNQLDMEGIYRLDSSYFDIGINMRRFQLQPWQAFLQEYIEQMEGILTADLQLQGTPDDPSVSGSFTFADELTLVPTFTGAVYYVNDEQINFKGTELVFNNFVIEDSARTQATLDGTIGFDNITNPVFNLTFRTDDFLFVNNESFENESFYGRAFATSFLEIKNSLNKLSITGDVSVNEGTDFTISLVDEAASASRADFINFVSPDYFTNEDTLAIDSITARQAVVADSALEISGFSLNTDIQISPEAQFTIVLDPVNGDQISASGEADLNVSMNRNGDVNIQGAYVIENGEYVLTFAQLIQKNFQIREGSSIVWSGDPTNARFDITAVYTTETTLEDLVPDSYRNEIMDADYITTEQPVNVVMMISGDLTEPELNFGIEVPELAAQGSNALLLQSLISQLEKDQNAMYKQVFGLIVLNRFIPSGGGLGSGGSNYTAAVNERIDNSLSRLLSSTLNGLTQEYLGGIQLNMDLESDQFQSQNTALADRSLDVSLSKAFFNDRLRVSVGGMTALNTNSEAEQQMANAASDNDIYGEFEILYRLDTKGNLNIRIFQESERNIFNNDVRQLQGVSLTYQHAFDAFFENKQDVIENRPGSEDNEDKQQKKKDSAALDNSQRKKRKPNKP
jgi:translocation and assembly module TamB